MSRFAIGDQVVTPKDIPGVIGHIYPGNRTTTYSVLLSGRKNGAIFYERELRAAPAIPPSAVYCRDCIHAKPGLLPNTRRCVIFNQFRSTNAPRLCRPYSALQSGTR